MNKEANLVMWLRENKYAFLYLMVALPTLLAMCFVVAPFGVADEPAHFLRADQISNGGFLPLVLPEQRAAGGYVDEQASELAKNVPLVQRRSAVPMPNQKVQTRQLVFNNFNNTVIYFPAAYLIPAGAIRAARALRLRPVDWIYAGRIANAISAVLITALAISLLKSGAAVALVISLSPMALSEEASLAPDSVVIPLSLLFVGLLLTIIQPKRIISLSFHLFLIVTLIVLCVGKIAYIPLAFLPPAIAFFQRRKWNEVIKLSAISVAVIVVWFAWSLCIRGKVFPISSGNIDVEKQADIILHDPAKTVHIIGMTLVYNARFIIRSFFGGFLGWQSVKTPWPLVILAAVNLLVASVVENKFLVKKISSICIIFSTAACSLLVIMAVYLQNTPVGGSSAIGVQGRYFIPLFLLTISALPQFGISIKQKYIDIFVYYFVASGIASCTWLVVFLSQQNWVS